MPLLALYTCPVLVRRPGDAGHAAFAAVDRAINDELRGAAPAGLVWAAKSLEAPRRWPDHVAAACGMPKPTLSLWCDLESAFAYSYGPGAHRNALRRRREWFALLGGPAYVLWYPGNGAAVGHEEAARRLAHLAALGPGPQAFDFRHPYGPDGLPLDARPLAALLRGADEAPSVRSVPLPLREPER